MDDKTLPRNSAEIEAPETAEMNSEELEQVAGGIYSLPQPMPGQDIPV